MLKYLGTIGLEKYKGGDIKSYLERHYNQACKKYGREIVGFKLFKEDIAEKS